MNQDFLDPFAEALGDFLLEPRQLFAPCPPLPEWSVAPPVEPTQTTVQNAKKRKRFSYSSKKLLADKQLYLLEGLNTSITTKIVGKVVGCPGVKTGNTFRIQWDHSTLNPLVRSPRHIGNGQRNMAGDNYNNPDIHFPIASKKKTKCTVCRLELHMNKTLGHGNLARGVATCSCCGVHAHSCVLIDSNRQIHKLPVFVNLSCFEIMHSGIGYEIWPRPNSQNGQKRLYPTQDHSVVKQLKEFHNVSRKSRRHGGGNIGS